MTTVPPRLLFCSYHSYLDPASGAARSTRDLLELLAARGWNCAVLSGPLLDGATATPEAVLQAEGQAYRYRPGTVGDVPCRLLHSFLNGVNVHGFQPDPAQGEPDEATSRAFLQVFDQVADRFRPEVVWTYGGQPLALSLLRRARRRGAKVVFALHNLAYGPSPLFAATDAVVVPSEFARRHYRQVLGREPVVLPGPWNPQRLISQDNTGEFATFVGPRPDKGVGWFARLLQETSRCRPDIRFLAVEGRGQAGWLARTGLDLAGVRNLHVLPPTTDPRRFYGVSRLVLVPSLVRETLGRVAVEALLNGLPVLASDRGGLPEALAGAGFLFPMGEDHRPDGSTLPTAADVRPWLETIVRLWDDTAFHRAANRRACAAAEAWHPAQLLPRFEAFLCGLTGR